MAVESTITIFAGEAVTLSATRFASTPTISGWAIKFQVKASRSTSASALITKTVGSGVTITSGSSGTFTVTLTAADTSGLTPGDYVFEISRTDSGSERVMAWGKFSIEPRVIAS